MAPPQPSKPSYREINKDLRQSLVALRQLTDAGSSNEQLDLNAVADRGENAVGGYTTLREENQEMDAANEAAQQRFVQSLRVANQLNTASANGTPAFDADAAIEASRARRNETTKVLIEQAELPAWISDPALLAAADAFIKDQSDTAGTSRRSLDAATREALERMVSHLNELLRTINDQPVPMHFLESLLSYHRFRDDKPIFEILQVVLQGLNTSQSLMAMVQRRYREPFGEGDTWLMWHEASGVKCTLVRERSTELIFLERKRQLEVWAAGLKVEWIDDGYVYHVVGAGHTIISDEDGIIAQYIGTYYVDQLLVEF